MKSMRLRSGMIYLLLVIALASFLYTMLSRRNANELTTVPLADVATLVRSNDTASIAINGDELLVTRRNGQQVQSRKETENGLTESLMGLGVTSDQLQRVDVSVAEPDFWANWSGILFALVPILLLGLFFFFILRQAQGAGNQAFSFGKSKARMFTGDRPTVTFADVAGSEEAKQELQEVVEFLKEPQKFAALGAQGRAAGRPARHRQDPHGQGRLGRGGRALLQHLRLRVRRDVCGRGRQPRARPL